MISHHQIASAPRFAYIPAVRTLTPWFAVAALWALGVAVFIGLSWFVLWISGRLMSLSGRGRRRG